MKEVIKLISNTTVIAVLLVLGAATGLGYLLVRYGSDATTRTQIITGIFGLLGPVVGYYYGSSKQRPVPGVTQTADTITNQPSPTDAGTTTIVTTPAS